MSAVADPLPHGGMQINIPRPTAPFTDFAPKESAVVPPQPESLEDTGISVALVEQLILKFLYFRGEVIGRELAGLLGLQYSLIDDLLETLKRQHNIGIKKSLGMGNSSGIFALTEAGRNLAREYLANNQYAGTAPVPLHQYSEVVRRQKLAENWLRPESLKNAFKHLVVEPDILAQHRPRCERQ